MQQSIQIYSGLKNEQKLPDCEICFFAEFTKPLKVFLRAEISLDDLDEVGGEDEPDALPLDAELVLEVPEEVAEVDVKHLEKNKSLNLTAI